MSIAESITVSTAVACESVNELVDLLRADNAHIRIVGSGTWLHGGRPVVNDKAVSTSALCKVVEYVPGDLTMTVQAGATLAQLDALTAAEGQWLGIDAPGSSRASIGAVIATAAYGPLAHGIGRMRDLVLGVETVTGDGRIIRSGGKVVKNVAGFDLVRLQTGAFGTLGILTEISVRLRAVPEVDATVAIALDPRKQLLAQLVLFRDLTLAPLAVELVGGALAQHLDIGNAPLFLVRLGGNETRVNAQLASLATLGTLVTVNNSVWQTLRDIESEHDAVARVSHLPTELAHSWTHVCELLSTLSLQPSLMRATVARGTMRVVIKPPADMSVAEFDAALASAACELAPPGGHVVWEQLPAHAWKRVTSAVDDAVSTGLQRAFDPAGRLNTGILGATRQ